MQSIDTNVLVRVIVRDNALQAAAADAVLGKRSVIQVTVALEAYWVLHSLAKLSVPMIADAFRILMKTRNLHFVHHQELAWALDRAVEGADFTDMLDLALSRNATSFVTFDQRIARHAADSPVPVETL